MVVYFSYPTDGVCPNLYILSIEPQVKHHVGKITSCEEYAPPCLEMYLGVVFFTISEDDNDMAKVIIF